MIACAVLGFSWYFFFIALQHFEIKENSDSRLEKRNSQRNNLQRRCKIMALTFLSVLIVDSTRCKNIYDADESFTFP